MPKRWVGSFLKGSYLEPLTPVGLFRGMFLLLLPEEAYMSRQVWDLLSRCSTEETVLPPTELFKEGWMLRLVLDWIQRNPAFSQPFSFQPGARWYSEALLSSRFLARFRGDPLSEQYTHADGVVGHFEIAPGERGEATVSGDATQLVVVEAKLGSGLSKGVKNAPGYGQAARNIACMAHMIDVAGLKPETVTSLGFFVLAPARQIEAGVFGDLVTKDVIEGQVWERVNAYGGIHDEWYEESFLPTLAAIKVGLLSWEEILAKIEVHDPEAGLNEFYGECLRFSSVGGSTV